MAAPPQTGIFGGYPNQLGKETSHRQAFTVLRRRTRSISPAMNRPNETAVEASGTEAGTLILKIASCMILPGANCGVLMVSTSPASEAVRPPAPNGIAVSKIPDWIVRWRTRQAKVVQRSSTLEPADAVDAGLVKLGQEAAE